MTHRKYKNKRISSDAKNNTTSLAKFIDISLSLTHSAYINSWEENFELKLTLKESTKISQILQKLRMTSKGYMLAKLSTDVTIISELH